MGTEAGQRRIVALIIGLSQSQGAQEVASRLASRIPVREIPEVRVPVSDNGTVAWGSRVDSKVMAARLARLPMIGEIGCALAHQDAYTALLSSEFDFALIMENDSRVADWRAFDVALGEALGAVQRSGVIVSFYVGDTLGKLLDAGLVPRVVMLPFRPSFAVAYLIDRRMAQLLQEWNTPVRDVADWPGDVTREHLRYVTRSTVFPDKHQESSVNPAGLSRQPSLSRRIQIISFVWWLRNRAEFPSWKGYWAQLILPRLRYHWWRIAARRQAVREGLCRT
jgi:hypothetical protein